MWWQRIVNLFLKPQQPKPTIYQMTGTDMWQKLDDAGLAHPFGIMDGIYNYTDLTGWKMILPLLLTTDYVAELDDCEDLALQATLDSSKIYKLNSIGLAVGTKDGAGHGFCFLYVKDVGFMLFEEQKGFNYGRPFAIGANGYVIGQVFI